jgi:phospholipase A1/A2
MRRLLFFACLFAAAPAAAQVRAVPAPVASEQEALRGVEVYLVNEGQTPLEAEGPRELEVTAADGTRLVLERVPGAKRTLAPGEFAKARYVPVSVAGAVIPPAQAHPAAELPESGETVVASSTGSSAGVLERFEPHEPVYGVGGLDDAGAKLQVSFAFRPFSDRAPLKLGNLRFAYTQTMFWALDRPSGPFRATNYSPEIYADIPVSDTATLALGYRHDSNGRGVADSVDVNRIFLRAEKSFDLGGNWRVDIAPQAWFYVGKSGALPISDTWGYTSLTASIGQQDGVKLAVTGRGNFRTRKGSAELFVSYPLARIARGVGFYLFGQAYTGFGEALDDWNRRDSHARIGIALTR